MGCDALSHLYGGPVGLDFRPGRGNFCGSREHPDETGRIIPIAHPKRAICELCIDYADEQTEAARLARRAPKAKRGKFRRINRHRIGG